MKLFDRILEEIGWPPIFLVTPEQYLKLEKRNWHKEDDWGWAGEKYPIISQIGKCNRKMRANIYWHEILHLLYPWQKHWWIEAVASKMARGGGTGEACRLSGHTPDDVPNRTILLEMIRKQAKKYRPKLK